MSAESKNPAGGGNFNLGNVLVYSAAFVIVVAGLQAAASILIPVLLAVFITIVLTPPYFALLKWLSPPIALAVMICGLVVASFGMVSLVGNAIEDFTAKKETYKNNLTKHTETIKEFFVGDDSEDTPDTGGTPDTEGTPDTPATAGTNSLAKPPAGTGTSAPSDTIIEKTALEEFVEKIQVMLTENLEKTLEFTQVAAGIVGALLGNTFLIVLIAIFLLLEAASLPKKIKNLPGMNDETWDRLTAAVVSVRQYTQLKTGLSLLTGFLCWLMLAFLGVEYAILFGLLAFILNYVPNIGSLIAAVPAVLIAWLGSPAESALSQAAYVTVGYLVLNTVIGNVLEPKVLDKGLGLSASIIVVTMVFWGWVLGPVGMLLSVPLTMIAKIALEASNDTQWIGSMMGSEEDKASPKQEATE